MPQAIRLVRDEATRRREQQSLNLDVERRKVELKHQVAARLHEQHREPKEDEELEDAFTRENAHSLTHRSLAPCGGHRVA